MTMYVINLSAWIVFIDLPTRVLLTAFRGFALALRALAVVHNYTMPNDPRRG